MKGLGLIVAFLVGGQTVLADGYVMGSGRWTCDRVVAASNGSEIERGQVYGWILSAWSQETFHRETGFIDTVERVGGLKIVDLTLAECRKAPPDAPLFRVVQSMMKNTY